MKILILEPDTNRQRQLRTILTSLGHKSAEIEAAVDGKSALSLIRKKRFDVAFIVSGVPGLPSLDFLKDIRTGGAAKGLPVVMYSAELTREIVVQAHEAGASGFLAYPFSVSDVEGALTAAMKRQ